MEAQPNFLDKSGMPVPEKTNAVAGVEEQFCPEAVRIEEVSKDKTVAHWTARDWDHSCSRWKVLSREVFRWLRHAGFRGKAGLTVAWSGAKPEDEYCCYYAVASI